MSLDPLTALSVAGTVIQFVDFGSKLISDSHKLYNSAKGSLSVNDELELVIAHFNELILKLKPPPSPGTKVEERLASICDGSTKLAEEMLARLDRLKVGQSKNKAWESFYKALRSAWTEKEQEELLNRLSRFRYAIQLQVLLEMKDSLSALNLQQSGRFDTLEEESRHIIAALLDDRTAASKDLQDQTRAIAQMLSRTELVIRDCENRTRVTIIDALAERGTQGIIRQGIESEDDAAMVLHAREEEHKANQTVQNGILESLRFPNMESRHEEVDLKHSKTFEWIFQDTNAQQRPWSNFTEWLRQGSGTYWINGKAGSGKSTLMRYIFDSEQTRRELRTWAGSTPLSVAGFFFWNSGTASQRSQTGLLRALLFEVLSEHRDLIPVVLPWFWARGYSQLIDTPYHVAIAERYKFSESKLLQAFSTLMTQQVVPLKLCLFVDGLDEYEGDHDKLADLFKHVSASPFVKICASSRPLVVFEDVFKLSPSLRLEALTFNDIQQYVKENFNSNQRFQLLAQEESTHAPVLVQEVVRKARGVFLWVKLVVKSLLAGLNNRDSFKDLQKRLLDLPSELEALYEHMLFKRIDKFYTERASRIFQIVRASQQQVDTILTDATINEEAAPMTILGLSFADEEPEVAINAVIQPLSVDQASKRCQIMQDRLKVRCAGLIEIKGAMDDSPANIDGKIQYMHRTVRDYLEQQEVRQTLLNYTSDTGFHPNQSLLVSYILSLKLPVGNSPKNTFDVLVAASRAMMCASAVENDTGNPELPLLDTLDGVVSHWCSDQPQVANQAPPHWGSKYVEFGLGPNAPRKREMAKWHDSFISLAVQYGLCAYVKIKLMEPENSHLVLTKPGRPLLHYAVDPGFHEYAKRYPIKAQMVANLLDLGGDPNLVFDGSSAWQYSLNTVKDLSTTSAAPSRRVLSEWLQILTALLENGAKSRPSAVFSVSKVFEERVPVEAAGFLKQLKEREVVAQRRFRLGKLGKLEIWRRGK